MKVITVINDVNNANFNLLKLSCFVNGLKLITLIANNDFSTRRIKDYLLLDYLSDDSIDQNEIIFFTDGTDAVFTASENEILSKYYSFNKKIVFSAELGCWPDPGMSSEYPEINSKTPYKYLNSGGFIGVAKDIKELLQENDFDLNKFPRSNQYLWTKRYFKNTDKIALDVNCEIFCVFFTDVAEEYFPGFEGDDLDYNQYYEHKKEWFNANFTVNGTRLQNNLTKTLPCHLHFNGFAKFLIDNDIHEMVYANIEKYRAVEYYTED
ncbi:glycosyltransferase domain-containing protein [Flavobacterium hibisci]|uniref:glycosyltransferase domain-containing protein n=1 Tax=Flavobacterium hibisci TaxID=1914462 RepID=UPI001CBB4C7B|nr:glycosyltransferase domain-containing protein [Flavobacterium hibisci]MBZ4042605.1 hypothetical protein [Flavobacterium hibisci]